MVLSSGECVSVPLAWPNWFMLIEPYVVPLNFDSDDFLYELKGNFHLGWSHGLLYIQLKIQQELFSTQSLLFSNVLPPRHYVPSAG